MTTVSLVGTSRFSVCAKRRPLIFGRTRSTTTTGGTKTVRIAKASSALPVTRTSQPSSVRATNRTFASERSCSTMSTGTPRSSACLLSRGAGPWARDLGHWPLRVLRGSSERAPRCMTPPLARSAPKGARPTPSRKRAKEQHKRGLGRSTSPVETRGFWCPRHSSGTIPMAEGVPCNIRSFW